MKYILLIFTATFLLLPLELFAQDTRVVVQNKQRTETLFDRNVDYGGFGALQYGVSYINGEAVYLRGTRGAFVVNFRPNHTFNIGYGSYRTATNFSPIGLAPEFSNAELRTKYDGFELEYVNSTRKLIHFSTQVTIGSGEVRFDDRNIELPKTKDTYFFVQPGLNVNLNLTTWFRLSLGAYYRFANGVDIPGTSDIDLSGPSAMIGLKFGAF